MSNLKPRLKHNCLSSPVNLAAREMDNYVLQKFSMGSVEKAPIKEGAGGESTELPQDSSWRE